MEYRHGKGASLRLVDFKRDSSAAHRVRRRDRKRVPALERAGRGARETSGITRTETGAAEFSVPVRHYSDCRLRAEAGTGESGSLLSRHSAGADGEPLVLQPA